MTGGAFSGHTQFFVMCTAIKSFKLNVHVRHHKLNIHIADTTNTSNYNYSEQLNFEY